MSPQAHLGSLLLIDAVNMIYSSSQWWRQTTKGDATLHCIWNNKLTTKYIVIPASGLPSKATSKLPCGSEDSPHTKLSGTTSRIFLPFNDSGWAQVASTSSCCFFLVNQSGNHLSWQSQRKLSLLMRLGESKEKQRKRIKCFLKKNLQQKC